jgi:hypothetical protein
MTARPLSLLAVSLKNSYWIPITLLITTEVDGLSSFGSPTTDMAQAVSRRPLIAEARVRSRGQSMWDLWWTKWH